MSATNQPHSITFIVEDLPKSTSFYLTALRPLGYRFVSEFNNRTLATRSKAIGLGPENTSRVDLYLSQSKRRNQRSTSDKIAHVVFIAASRSVVQDFYIAALDVGGTRVLRPHVSDRINGTYLASVSDMDGNVVEVLHYGLEPSRSSSSSVTKSRNHVANSTAFSDTTELPINPSAPRVSTRGYSDAYGSVQPFACGQRSQNKHRSHARSTASQKGFATSFAGTDKGVNAIVGTLMGATAGAVLAYTTLCSQKDSRSKENKLNTDIKSKRHLKEEATAHVEKSSADQIVKGKVKARRRNGVVDRDSGYCSIDLPTTTQSLERLKGRHKTFQYTESENHSRKLIEGPRKSSNRNASSSRKASITSSKKSTSRYNFMKDELPQPRKGPPSIPLGILRMPLPLRTRYCIEPSRSGRGAQNRATIPRQPSESPRKPFASSSYRRHTGPLHASNGSIWPSSSTETYRNARQSGVTEAALEELSYYHKSELMAEEQETIFPDDSISCISARPSASS